MRLQATLLGLVAVASSVHAAGSSPNDFRPLAVRATPASNACSLAASASASYSKASPSATAIMIPAELAYDCLETIPNKQQPALDLLNGLSSWLEFQSDKNTYLLNPPEGFLFPGVDLDKYMATIRNNVQTGNYDSEYDFQIDIQAMMIGAKNGHFLYNGDATGLFIFQRQVSLASISVDGKQIPQIYVTHDLVQSNAEGTKLHPVTGYTPSPVIQIGSEDSMVNALDFLLSQCLVGLSQDPDSLYNQNFYQLARIIPGINEPSLFELPRFYPGPNTVIKFANGTTNTYPNLAIVDADLQGITTGEQMYTAFCNEAEQNKRKRAVKEPMRSERSLYYRHKEAQLEPRQGGNPLPFYPNPVVSHSANAVSGYYLDAAGFQDVAVLAIYTFEPENPDEDNGGEAEFQQVVQTFLADAKKAGKSKLIIDLQGNGGGLIDLGLDTFAQLFPTIKPNVKSNMRGTIGMNLLAQSASLLVTQDAADKTNSQTQDETDLIEYTPFAYQSVMTPDAKSFATFNSFYGPVYADGGHFTNFFQNNYTNSFSSDPFGQGIVITGNGNRSTGFTQTFQAQNIILLHDGFCASTCTTFSEFMKNFANVQSITIGGRPQTGPMQGVGGVKGAQIFDFTSFPAWIKLFHSGLDRKLKQAQGTVFQYFTNLPFLRSEQTSPGGVNGRNSFRIGDTSNTPLQYVYEASDCRMWWTKEMLYDPTFLWNRVAQMAFKDRSGTKFNSQYCIQDSTGHPTSIGGGWKQGTLGPQTPPSNAKLQANGWITDGDILDTDGPAGTKSPSSSGTSSGNSSGSTVSGGSLNVHKSQAVTDACKAYTGDVWMVKMVCAALSF